MAGRCSDGRRVIDIGLAPVADFAALEARWRALEATADSSFFQSWTWTGCLAAARFPDPVLLEARQDGTTVALALFNRRGRLRETLWLGETGDAAHDAPYIEYNGVLLARHAPAGLGEACLRAARQLPVGRRRAWLPRRLILSGVDAPGLAAAQAAGPVHVRRCQAAPWVELSTLRDAGAFLDRLSANTRYQLRRSDRRYAAAGPLTIHRAADAAEAHAALDALAELHQAHWRSRGQPGAFARPFFARFHHTLIDRGFARDEIDLLRVAAGGTLVGVLYNFRYRGRMLAYQSGFAYAAAAQHEKPGLTCHHQAIRLALAGGCERYDLLAGDARYKRSLADQAGRLHWLEVGPRSGVARIAQKLTALLERGRRR
jgi:CelD/BcsL family acetyltransferase involved in cellulose biosynthesis